MQQVLYSKLEEHSKVHRDIVSSLISVRDRVATASVDELIKLMEELMEGWLAEHILRYDLKLKDLLP
jgi:hemerythrin